MLIWFQPSPQLPPHFSLSLQILILLILLRLMFFSYSQFSIYSRTEWIEEKIQYFQRYQIFTELKGEEENKKKTMGMFLEARTMCEWAQCALDKVEKFKRHETQPFQLVCLLSPRTLFHLQKENEREKPKRMISFRRIHSNLLLVNSQAGQRGRTDLRMEIVCEGEEVQGKRRATWDDKKINFQDFLTFSFVLFVGSLLSPHGRRSEKKLLLFFPCFFFFLM